MADDATREAGAVWAPFADTLYPPPPSIYTKYTRRNLALLQDLREKIAKDLRSSQLSSADEVSAASARDVWLRLDPPARIKRQNALLKSAKHKSKKPSGEDGDEKMTFTADSTQNLEARTDEEQGQASTAAAYDDDGDGVDDDEDPLPDFDLQLELQPPRLDWIEEEGDYFCFSERWPIHERLLPLSAHPGMIQLYPEGSIDRKATLHTLLRTLLATYFKLITILQSPPRDYLASVPDPHAPPSQIWKSEMLDLSAFIRTTTINMQHLLNEMRPAQAVEGLRELMKEQLERRRQETSAIRSKCTEVHANIAAMRVALSSEEPVATGAITSK
ncbi:hypothetical protein K437DRAFT_263020 [Tilletiaria anomala UBC 951]|uniref:Mediator of RNA polymerase II transcription subunit 7 n=1 Tax=Tilletiaria anomala (strain ATCC 24038 / CBS 436.72 / UBC 951) TaxID=1037660 RepID=A0A066W2P5_TILAU|nr:uncharacterized protein K437DRAFT_263020 [Tilletiaria anomala UBC 951]KDN45065.1 hypothetical protein K437DRAFT_263020 [Tilletiaria anomala UBC 951]